MFGLKIALKQVVRFSSNVKEYLRRKKDLQKGLHMKTYVTSLRKKGHRRQIISTQKRRLSSGQIRVYLLHILLLHVLSEKLCMVLYNLIVVT